MSGIYIHIPFCRQACHYCDFHFSTSLKTKAQLVQCINTEIISRKEYLNDPVIQTIYFGGGTPSLLSMEELNSILDTVYSQFDVRSDAEITLEANPDDLTSEYLQQLAATRVNRLSIGVQSFRNEDLQWMNRAHNADQAIQSIQDAASAGFKNISIDLIYGVPGLSHADWKSNLEIALQLPVQHLSCYCLTVEPKTALGHFVQKEYVHMPGEEVSSSQFKTLLAMSGEAGFLQYEISNLSKPGFESKHNSSYWKGVHYLGAGPSAHSYDGISREWNVSNNALYIKSISEGNRAYDREMLSEENRFNEYIMVSLRTSWGIDLAFVSREYGASKSDRLLSDAASFITSAHLMIINNHLILTEEGKLIADRMAAELFI